MNTGKTLFAQIMEFAPWSTFSRIVERHQGNARTRTLSCAEHFRALAFAQLTWRDSLRDIESCLASQPGKLYGMGFRHPIRRSTLADANESRPWQIWEEWAQVLIRQARQLYAGDSFAVELDEAVYALDSSLIDLCRTLFPWATCQTVKSAVKLHTLLDLRGSIPAYVRVTKGNWHDVNLLDHLAFEPGSIYVMDRGYLDFARLFAMHQTGAHFIIRAKSPLKADRVYSAPTDRQAGVICDQRVRLTLSRSVKRYPDLLRRVRYKDPATGRTLVFLTNHTTLPSLTICDLYRCRWQVEIFFKWVKQNLCIKHFLGTSENAVKTQIWCAIATYVLIAILKKRLHVAASLHTCLQILSVLIFEKTTISSALTAGDCTFARDVDPNQLFLFDF